MELNGRRLAAQESHSHQFWILHHRSFYLLNLVSTRLLGTPSKATHNQSPPQASNSNSTGTLQACSNSAFASVPIQKIGRRIGNGESAFAFLDCNFAKARTIASSSEQQARSSKQQVIKKGSLSESRKGPRQGKRREGRESKKKKEEEEEEEKEKDLFLELLGISPWEAFYFSLIFHLTQVKIILSPLPSIAYRTTFFSLWPDLAPLRAHTHTTDTTHLLTSNYYL